MEERHLFVKDVAIVEIDCHELLIRRPPVGLRTGDIAREDLGAFLEILQQLNSLVALPVL